MRLTERVFPDVPFHGGWASPGIYRAEGNQHGALSVRDSTGGLLGIKPAEFEALPALDWVIVGGESGPASRPMEVAWPRSAVAQCKAAGVAVFVKQMGHWIQGDHEGFVLDRWLLDNGHIFVPPVIGERAFARPENAVAFTIGGKGGAMVEWPADLRVREFPA